MGGGFEGGLEMRGELVCCIGVGRRGGERRDLEVVELDVVGDRGSIPTVDSELGLAVVGGGAHKVDGDVLGGDEAGEVEELVEVALCWQGHHDHYNFGLVKAIWGVVLAVLVVSHR